MTRFLYNMTYTENNKVYEKVPTKEVVSENEEKQVPTYGYGIRHVQTLLLFICMIVGYIARAHLGVSIVAMTNAIDHFHYNNTTLNMTSIILNGTDVVHVDVTNAGFEVNRTDYMNVTKSNEDSIWNVYRTYAWTKPVQEYILGAFFVGYCIAMFPTGMICQRFGGKLPLQICLLVNGIATLATPTVAVWGGWQAVYCCRVIQGVSQAGLYPSAHCLLAKWVPVSEKATLSSFVYTGTLVGTVLAFQVGGVMASTSAGWPATFWLVGALCVATFLMLTFFGAASPDLHKTISETEKNYILGKIDDGLTKKVSKTPWKSIFTSKPLWSTFITHVAAGFCFVFLFIQAPAYMHYILGYDVKNSGLLSSLPYIASSISNMGFGYFSDFCINRGYLSTKSARLVCNSVAQFGCAICLALVTFTYNSGIAVCLLIMAVALFVGVHSGWMVNYIDLSPNFSGSLMATGAMFSTIAIIFLPVLISNVVVDAYDRHQWRIVMFIMAAFISIANAVFVLFMSSDRQPWDQCEEQEETNAEKSREFTLTKTK